MHIFVKTVYFYRGKGAGFFVYSVLTKNVLCRSNSSLYFYGARLESLRTFCFAPNNFILEDAIYDLC